MIVHERELFHLGLSADVRKPSLTLGFLFFVALINVCIIIA